MDKKKLIRVFEKSYRYDTVDGAAPIYKDKVSKIAKKDKEFKGELFDGTRVYLVNGKWIRDNIDVAWLGGGHDQECDWIPKGEIWVEKTDDPSDAEKVLAHEIIEWIQMKFHKVKYEKAHDIANSAENILRKIDGDVK
jgi:hypothetical protein